MKTIKYCKNWTRRIYEEQHYLQGSDNSKFVRSQFLLNWSIDETQLQSKTSAESFVDVNKIIIKYVKYIILTIAKTYLKKSLKELATWFQDCYKATAFNTVNAVW